MGILCEIAVGLEGERTTDLPVVWAKVLRVVKRIHAPRCDGRDNPTCSTKKLLPVSHRRQGRSQLLQG